MPVQCTVCNGRSFENEAVLQAHQKSKWHMKRQANPLKCSFCADTFETLDSRIRHEMLQKHRQTKHPSLPSTAPGPIPHDLQPAQATATFSEQVASSASSNLPSSNSETGMQLPSDVLVESQSSDPQIFEEAPRSAEEVTLVNTQDEGSSACSRIQCTVCNGRLFKDEAGLQDHQNSKLHKKRQAKQLKCNFCAGTFKTIESRIQHETVTHTKCLLCSEICKSPKQLKKHKQTKHPSLPSTAPAPHDLQSAQATSTFSEKAALPASSNLPSSNSKTGIQLPPDVPIEFQSSNLQIFEEAPHSAEEVPPVNIQEEGFPVCSYDSCGPRASIRHHQLDDVPEKIDSITVGAKDYHYRDAPAETQHVHSQHPAAECSDSLLSGQPTDGGNQSATDGNESVSAEQHGDEHVKHPNDESTEDKYYSTTPSPTPSEHGSDGSRYQLLEARPASLHSSVLSESFDDPSVQSSPLSSSRSVACVSINDISEHVKVHPADRSHMSPSSTPRLGLPPSSSLESLEQRRGASNDVVPQVDVTMPQAAAHRLHCRICQRDPCEDMTATICGHIFCKKCITQAVVAKSECPVCKSATLLYCLFKLDLSV
ncbi:hypothetical protein HYDPIDRAFT_41465 [Hydnomerulius pinastri MD-312]|uniref:Unplaced genomic scaffold scaffold_18, whole genome shotgun sequence n=1 Tax=Hydnomerulius pinastri MD-312 TaxID=994086 RepID=A0A0C9W7L9_9AGAM|nr:hypothetical protein HYDPIDRAFT_41465 [Hydnomerulius pinastri MD-312]